MNDDLGLGPRYGGSSSRNGHRRDHVRVNKQSQQVTPEFDIVGPNLSGSIYFVQPADNYLWDD